MLKTYTVHDSFLTLQGEGSRAGTPAVFVRMSFCNLWNGRPADRAKGKGACSQWCDTSFFGGPKYTATELVARMEELRKGTSTEWCVLTGGEPGLQVDITLLVALKNANWKVAVETNGSVANTALFGVDHLCVSPKIGGGVALLDLWRPIAKPERMELKLVLPGTNRPGEEDWTPETIGELGDMLPWDFKYLHPADPGDPATVGRTYLTGGHDAGSSSYANNLASCIALAKSLKGWQVGVQLHKIMGVP